MVRKAEKPSKYGESYYQYLRCVRTGISLLQEKQFIFWKQFSNVFLSGISNISIFKVSDVLHQEISYERKPSSIFSVAPSVGAGNIWIYYMSHLFPIIANKFYLH